NYCPPPPFHYSPSLHSLLSCLSTDPPPTEIYTLSLHDALPISERQDVTRGQTHVGAGVHADTGDPVGTSVRERRRVGRPVLSDRSEEHTSELQSRFELVCRLLLEKKKLWL